MTTADSRAVKAVLVSRGWPPWPSWPTAKTPTLAFIPMRSKKEFDRSSKIRTRRPDTSGRACTTTDSQCSHWPKPTEPWTNAACGMASRRMRASIVRSAKRSSWPFGPRLPAKTKTTSAAGVILPIRPTQIPPSAARSWSDCSPLATPASKSPTNPSIERSNTSPR